MLLIVTFDPNYYPIYYIFYCKVTIFKSIEVKANNQIQLNQSKVKGQAYIQQKSIQSYQAQMQKIIYHIYHHPI